MLPKREADLAEPPKPPKKLILCFSAVDTPSPTTRAIEEIRLRATVSVEEVEQDQDAKASQINKELTQSFERVIEESQAEDLVPEMGSQTHQEFWYLKQRIDKVDVQLAYKHYIGKEMIIHKTDLLNFNDDYKIVNARQWVKNMMVKYMKDN
ncbi:hypothetical protein VTO42DRAFT_7665 [Malbranchea cinnamomea]